MNKELTRKKQWNLCGVTLEKGTFCSDDAHHILQLLALKIWALKQSMRNNWQPNKLQPNITENTQKISA